MAVHRKQIKQPRGALSRPQWAIYCEGWKPEARFRAAVCGRRFGKTFLAREEIRRACRLAVQRNISTENEIWYAAPTFKQAKRVFWKPLKKAIPTEWVAGKPNETECTITLKSGHVIRLVGLDAYDNLRGSGLFFVIVDEWADCPFAAWTETLRPMLSTAGGHALWIGTPKGFDHLYDSYRAGQPGGEADHKSFLFTTLEGGNVPQSEIDAALRNLDARTFRQEYCASFETFEGRVIYAFTRTGNVRPCAYDPSLPIEIGVDFNINPMTGVILQKHGDEDWQVDEIILPTSNTDDLVAEIKARYPRNGSFAHITCYPDPAGVQRRTSAGGRTDISILQAAGFSVLATNVHPLVRDRLKWTNSRFESADGTRRLFVDPKCKKSIEAYERLTYKEGSNDPDKSSGFDHCVDALGYAVMGKYAYKPTTTARKVHMAR